MTAFVNRILCSLRKSSVLNYRQLLLLCVSASLFRSHQWFDSRSPITRYNGDTNQKDIRGLQATSSCHLRSLVLSIEPPSFKGASKNVCKPRSQPGLTKFLWLSCPLWNLLSQFSDSLLPGQFFRLSLLHINWNCHWYNCQNRLPIRASSNNNNFHFSYPWCLTGCLRVSWHPIFQAVNTLFTSRHSVWLVYEQSDHSRYEIAHDILQPGVTFNENHVWRCFENCL